MEKLLNGFSAAPSTAAGMREKMPEPTIYICPISGCHAEYANKAALREHLWSRHHLVGN
jgi:hypothetical protein